MHYPVKIGWYGGSFNPPHLSHQAVVLWALETLELDSLLVSPAYKHAEGKALAPYRSRVDMVALMLHKIADHRVQASMDEWHAHKDGHSPKGLTVDTLAYVRSTYVRAGYEPTIYMIVGGDVARGIESWEGYERLKQDLDAGRVVLAPVERTDGVSSTKIRQHFHDGHYNQARPMLPGLVHDYILRNRLYVAERDVDSL